MKTHASNTKAAQLNQLIKIIMQWFINILNLQHLIYHPRTHHIETAHKHTKKTRNRLIFYKPSISRISIEASAAPSLAMLGCSFIRPSVRCSEVLESASYNNNKKILEYLRSLWSMLLGCIGTPNYVSIWMLPLQLKDQQDWQSRNAASLNITVHFSSASTAQWVIWKTTTKVRRCNQPTTGEITISEQSSALLRA